MIFVFIVSISSVIVLLSTFSDTGTSSEEVSAFTVTCLIKSHYHKRCRRAKCPTVVTTMNLHNLKMNFKM